MTAVRFIHCADLHLGTPFKGISEINPALGKVLFQATYQAFDNLIDLAVRKRVDAVLIAGDIYDSEDKSLQAQLRFRRGLERLSEAGIPSFIAYGNHDPLNGWSATLKWPELMHFFPGETVECIPLIKNGETAAQIYGISHAKRNLKENLAVKFQPDEEKVPKIGLLHTNAINSAEHGPYAPCSREDLVKVPLDYWALGHIHKREVLRPANPAIVYPGCTQSTNPGETAAKGCILVTLEYGSEPEIKFYPVDTVRFKAESLDISDYQSIDEISEAAAAKCREAAGAEDNRHVIIRLAITGRTGLDGELRKAGSLANLLEDVRGQLDGKEPVIWVEKLVLRTAGAYDLETLRKGNNFTADLIAIFDEMQKPGMSASEEIKELLKPMFEKWQGSSYLALPDEEVLRSLAGEARDQMLDLLKEN